MSETTDTPTPEAEPLLPDAPPIPGYSYEAGDEEAKRVDYSKVSSQAGLQSYIHPGNIIRR